MGHDLGHTPFGHVGEQALRDVCGHFEHNEQSVRIVECLENDGRGLNLTEEVKDGMLNHSGNLKAHTLEGGLIKYADRIAYLCHDYDDAENMGSSRKGTARPCPPRAGNDPLLHDYSHGTESGGKFHG